MADVIRGKIKNCPNIADFIAKGKTDAEFKAECEKAGVDKKKIPTCVARFNKALENKDKVKRPRSKKSCITVYLPLDISEKPDNEILKLVKDQLAEIKKQAEAKGKFKKLNKLVDELLGGGQTLDEVLEFVKNKTTTDNVK